MVYPYALCRTVFRLVVRGTGKQAGRSPTVRPRTTPQATGRKSVGLVGGAVALLGPYGRDGWARAWIFVRGHVDSTPFDEDPTLGIVQIPRLDKEVELLSTWKSRPEKVAASETDTLARHPSQQSSSSSLPRPQGIIPSTYSAIRGGFACLGRTDVDVSAIADRYVFIRGSRIV